MDSVFLRCNTKVEILLVCGLQAEATIFIVFVEIEFCAGKKLICLGRVTLQYSMQVSRQNLQNSVLCLQREGSTQTLKFLGDVWKSV